MGVEHHLLRLPEITAGERHPAMAEPDVIHLHRNGGGVQDQTSVDQSNLAGVARRDDVGGWASTL